MTNVSVFNDLVSNDRDVGRKARRPTHTFNLRHRPFVVQPFLLAPVLPGETLNKASLQSRVVADPVKDKMTGAHCEYFFFYVKLRDLDGRADFEEMLINPDKDISAYYDTADDREYYYEVNGMTTGIAWQKLAYQRIVKEYFRGDDEAWDDYTDSVSGLAVASVNNVPGWIASLIAADDFTAVNETISTAGDDAFTMSELEIAMNNYKLAKVHGLTQKSFEDYLQQSGVSVAQAVEEHKPELLFMQRDWTYPTNAVEPTDGSVASSWVWSPQMLRNNNKFFTEPGFIMGVTLVRPKVYYENLTASPACLMNGLSYWLTPDLRNDNRAGSIAPQAGTGPAGAGLDTEGYRFWLDDNLLYGDQWYNYVMDSNTSSVALPIDGTNLINRRYPVAADINDIFVDDENASGLRYIRQDGICHFTIQSYVRDSMPGLPVSD